MTTIMELNSEHEVNKTILMYKILIHERVNDLTKSGKPNEEWDNNDLWKIFEWFECIQAMKEYKRVFLEYSHIDPSFKEENKMSQNDSGIDICDLKDTIIQCKLRNKSLTWGECGTFFGSQNCY